MSSVSSWNEWDQVDEVIPRGVKLEVGAPKFFVESGLVTPRACEEARWE